MQKIFFTAFLITAALFFLIPSHYAQEEGLEELKLLLGEPKSISAETPTRVAVGNPTIVDISSVSDKEIILVPKAKGRTTFFYRDSFGDHSFLLRVIPEDLGIIKARIETLLKELNLPRVYVRLVDSEDKLLLKGEVKSENDREQIFLALGELKDKVVDLIKIREEETVVDIDVQVLEVSKDGTQALGFTMPASISAGEPHERFSKALRASMDAIFHVFDWPRADFSVTLNALIQEGKARVLSQPRLACQSGKEAELLVGGEKPVFTTQVASAGGEGTSVEYKEYGIKLKIKPTVNPNNRIKVSLNVEVSEVGTAETIGSASSPTAKAYPLTKRNVSTEVFLNNGQTLGIGGLVKQKEESDVRKTAFLGDLPLLGLLFRSKTHKLGGGSGEKGNMELVILLTPTIVARDEQFIKDTMEEAASSFAKNSPQALSYYADVVKRHILNNFVYPSFAKEAGFQGTVKLGLHLSSAGELLEVLIKDSSGYKALDDYAVSSVRKISSYPSFPSSIDLRDLWVDIPIVYKLD